MECSLGEIAGIINVTKYNLLPIMQLDSAIIFIVDGLKIISWRHFFARPRSRYLEVEVFLAKVDVCFSLTASALCQVEPVGRWFEAFVKRRNRNASTSFQELEDKKELSEESEDEELHLEEFPMLKTLDPKDWKVLAVQSFRE